MTDQLKTIEKLLNKSKISKKEILNEIQSLDKNNVLIVGDFILDIYTKCTALGKTSKTPTLSVKKISSDFFLGGSGLFANLTSTVGAKTQLITILSKFGNLKEIKKIIDRKFKIKIFSEINRPTTSKERFWVDGYKLLQVDILENHHLMNKTEKKIIIYFEEQIKNYEKIIISDSRHGMMSSQLIKKIINITKKNKKLLFVDSQINSSEGNLQNYYGVDIVSANERELRMFMKNQKNTVEYLGRSMFKKLKLKKFLIISLADKGLILFTEEDKINFPAIPVNSIDPIGSGDTLLSFFLLTLKKSNNLVLSLFISSCAAAHSTTIMGTKPVSKKNLINFVDNVLNNLNIKND